MFCLCKMQPIRDVHMLLSCLFCMNFISPYQASHYAVSVLRQATYHRLRGSASPVLTATHHSYGSPRLSEFFFPHSPRGQTPQPIFMQNDSIDVDSRKDVPFAVKIATFHTPWSPGPLKGQNFANFWALEIFRSIWPSTLEVTERTPLILHRNPMKVA